MKVSREDLLRQLGQWIAEIREEDESITPSEEADLVDDLHLDSLGLAELRSKVARLYHVRLKPQDLSGSLKVGRLADLVLGQMAAEEAPKT